MLSTDREGALPDIHILYFGQLYNYSLPWHNAWVLLAITVPVSILAAAIVGLVSALRNTRRDRIPLYFLVHMITLPAVRMLDTPAHDGVRLFLPTFFFLAAFAGWGAVGIADGLARLVRTPATPARALMAALVLVPAGWQLVKVHPFELSYYNELIGGPRGAWKAGFELAYWWDAFNDRTIAELNERLPRDAMVHFLNDLDQPSTFYELQSLGHLRGDLEFGVTDPNQFPFVWLLTHDSKSTPFTRFLFAMTPWYARAPATGRPPGRDRGRSRGGQSGLGAPAPGRSRRCPPAPPTLRAGLGPSLRAVAGSILGRRAGAVAAPEGQ